jgi:cytochrome c oxidase subunit III
VASVRALHRGALAHQFDDLVQQREAATLGMWVFIVTEVMLFGGMFLGYTATRWLYRPGFVEGSRHMEMVVGAVNTAVLIVSSLMMAQAVQSAQRGRRRPLLLYLALTAALGLVFLGLKGFEYWSHARDGLVPGRLWRYEGPYDGPVQTFFFLYYAMTGLHAIHLTIGVALVAALIVLARRGAFSAVYHTPVEVIGLYWHLIDIIWVFLFPLFYLVK